MVIFQIFRLIEQEIQEKQIGSYRRTFLVNK